jgi:hypothetical protein
MMGDRPRREQVISAVQAFFLGNLKEDENAHLF